MKANALLETIGKSLREWREGREMSQAEAARVAGLSQNAMSLYERGERPPTLLAALRLAAYYEMSVEDLVGYDAEKDPGRAR